MRKTYDTYVGQRDNPKNTKPPYHPIIWGPENVYFGKSQLKVFNSEPFFVVFD